MGAWKNFVECQRTFKEAEGFCRKLKHFGGKGALGHFEGKEILGGSEEFIAIAKGFFRSAVEFFCEPIGLLVDL